MHSYHAPLALLPAGWAADVRLTVSAEGDLTSVEAGAGSDGSEPLAGPVIPGIPNLHSHAFQRALAGRSERPGAGPDSFWSWRQEMYRFVERLGPDEILAVATELYVELLEAGYTSVVEFHYLHRDPGGELYSDPGLLASAHVEAARRAGIGLTVLPVLYAHGGFGGADPDPGQRRFVLDCETLLGILDGLAAELASDPDRRVGLGLHSLRAVAPEELSHAVDAIRARDEGAPVHIHVAEQVREVEACLAWSGARPVEWLLDHAPVDPRWCLVHATHVTPAETKALAGSGAVAGLCPTTEANLGDGLFPFPAFLSVGGRWGVGSDSHVSVSPAEELRTLEYGQRLVSGERNVAGRATGGSAVSTGGALVRGAVTGGAAAAGRHIGRLEVGARGDWVVLESGPRSMESRAEDDHLDAWIFRGGHDPVRDVFVGGRPVVRDGRHPLKEESRRASAEALRRLLDD